MKTPALIVRLLGLVSVPLLLSGCTSITCGTRQEVSLYSKPSGAEVIVYSNHGELVYQNTTPCVANLRRTPPESGRANYVVLFKKKGYEPVQLQIKSVLNRAGLVDVVGAGASLFAKSNAGGIWTLQAAGDNPALEPSPDMLRPDGLCVGLKEERPGVVAAKVDPFAR